VSTVLISDRLGNGGLGVSRYGPERHVTSRGPMGPGTCRGIGMVTSEQGALMRTTDSTMTAFRPTRFRAGYATDEVDRFVEAVRDALGSRRSRLGGIDVAYQRFPRCWSSPVLQGRRMGGVGRLPH
jgi:hypothetical protein